MKPNQSFQEAFKPNSFQTANDSKLFQNTLQNNSDYKRKLYESYYKVQPEEKGDVESGSSQRKSCCCNPRVCWWEPPRENLPLDFCRDTSLHGLKYISQPQRHLTERIFWLFAFVIGALAAAYLISDVWRKYQLNPVIVSFQPYETTIDQIPFPAVTICNMNKVLKSKAEAYIKQARNVELSNVSALSALKNLYFLDHICTTPKPFSKFFKYSSKVGSVDQSLLDLTKEVEDALDGSVEKFLRQSSQLCSDMIKLCVWKGEIRNCKDLFRPIETDFGKCCTFNMVPGTLLHRFTNDTRDDKKTVEAWAAWDQEEDWGFTHASSEQFKYPRRQLKAGKASGLSILLDPALDEYFCATSDSVGFRLTVHQPMDFPHVMDYGHAIQPASETFVSVRSEINMAGAGLNRVPLKTLHYYNYYTANNCVDECLANLTRTNCSCVRYFMPRKPGFRLCGPQNFECAESVKQQAYRYGVKNICSGCLPVCTEIEYQMDTSLSHIQSQQNIWIDDSNVSASWSDRNVSIVHIFFGQESTYARVRKELYGQTDLIANTGGLLGLCLGFSGLSLMEVIYFLTLRFWCRRRRKRHIVTEIASKFTGLWKKAREKRLGRLGARAKDVDYDKEKNERTTSKSIRKNEGFMNKAENGKRHQRELESNPNFATSPYFIIAQELKHIGSNLKRKDNSMQPPKYHNVFGDVAVFVPERNAI